ncbi:MAG: hypothetical protein KAU10_04275 [Dehalococcoidia bacterium]|nr:hypothetical protein [Dehalococcoidia bacterium]
MAHREERESRKGAGPTRYPVTGQPFAGDAACDVFADLPTACLKVIPLRQIGKE